MIITYTMKRSGTCNLHPIKHLIKELFFFVHVSIINFKKVDVLRQLFFFSINILIFDNLQRLLNLFNIAHINNFDRIFIVICVIIRH